MKKKQWLLALFMALSFVFASCSGLIDGIMGSNDDDDDDSSSSRTLTITVDNYADVIDTSSSTARLSANVARTISADSYTNGDDLKFYVFGNSSDRQTLNPTSVDITKDTDAAYTGKVALDIPAANWYLTLVATASADGYASSDLALADAVLIGRANVDLRSGTDASFTLTYDGLSKVADININLIDEADWFDKFNADTTWSVKAGIYDRVTGDIIATSEVTIDNTAFANASEIPASDLTAAESSAFNYSVTSVTPGMYYFKVTFSNSTTKKNFVWGDLIRVIPGKTLKQNQTVPNVIGFVPTAPAKFYAEYTETLTEKPYADSYIVDFNWTRPTTGDLKNEQYFEIDIAEIIDDVITDNTTTTIEFNESAVPIATATDATDDTAWTDLKDDTTKGFKSVKTYTGLSYYATSATSPYYDSGVSSGSNAIGSSLFAGSGHAEFALELGKRYYARIRAVNDVGTSDYVYLELSGATADEGRKINGSDVTYNKFTSSTINLFRITYDPSGYMFYQASGVAGVTTNVLKYFCRDSSIGVDVINISGGTSSYNTSTLVWQPATYPVVMSTSSSGVLTKWLNIATGAVYSDTTYTGYTNLYLKAYGSGSTTYVISDPATYAINKKWITLTDSSGDLTAESGDFTANGSTWKANCKQGKITVALKMPASTGDTDKWVYDSVEFKITRSDSYQYLYEKKTSIKRDSSVSVESYLGVGYYQVMITGKYGNAVNSFTIDLTVTSN